MKRFVCIILTLMLAMSLCACSDDGGKKINSGSATVDDILEQQTAATPQPVQTAAPAALEEENEYISEPDPNVDVDLTALSSTAVYAEVYNMLTNPDDYIGKTVKMRGSFAMYHDEETDMYYFACIVADATACCSQGIEFVLAGEHTYPDDYPALSDEITVVGTFSTYYEGENMYCTLKDAVLE